MKTVSFDFNSISSLTQFYQIFRKKFGLSPHMVTNLDGLWDTLTGIIELPVKINFQNLNLDKLEKFNNLIVLFEEAEKETDSELRFSYFLSN
jgi:ribonuclease inhibitor